MLARQSIRKRLFNSFLMSVVAVGLLTLQASINAQVVEIHGTEIRFDPDNVDQAVVQKLGKYLQDIGFSDEREKTVGLEKVNETWQFKICVPEDREIDATFVAMCGQLASDMSNSMFDRQPVELHILDTDWKLRKVVAQKSMLGENKVVVAAVSIFFRDTRLEAKASDVGGFLEEIGFADGTPKTAQLVNEGNRYQVRFCMHAEYLEDAEVLQGFAQIAAALSEQVFDGQEVEIHLCDDAMKTVKRITDTGPANDF